MTPRDIALAFCAPLLWGFAFTLAKPAVAQFPPLLMMAMVYAVTAAALLRRRRIGTAPGPMLLIAVLGGALQAGLIFTGLTGTPASTAMLVIQSQVPFAVLVAWAIGCERLNPRRLAGIGVALAGVALVAGAPEAVAAPVPLLLVVLGALSWASAQALIRAHGRDDGRTTTGAIAAVSAPLCLVGSLLLERGQAEAIAGAGMGDWLGLAAFALLGFVVAYTIWYQLLQRLRVDQVTPFALLMPVTGVLASALLLGERPSAASLAGGLVILAGLGLIVRARPSAEEPA